VSGKGEEKVFFSKGKNKCGNKEDKHEHKKG
jgi:hypothetical protein